MAYTSVVSGVRASYNGLAANQKPDIDSVLKVLKPYQTPIMQFVFFSNKTSKAVISKTGKFSWFEDELFPHQTTVTAAISLTGATLVLTSSNVTNKSIFNLYDMVYIEPSDEVAYVTSVTAGGGSDVVLTHIDGSTTLTALAAPGDNVVYLKIIGSCMIELNTKRTAYSTKEIEKFNYLTMFSETVGLSGREQAGEAYTNGLDFAGQLQKKMEEMKLQFERNFIYSLTAGRDTSTGRTYGQGFLGRYTTNVSTYTGDLSEEKWEDHLQAVYSKGSNKRMHICGSNQLRKIQKFIKERVKIELSPNQAVLKKYGITVLDYVYTQGTTQIVWDPVLDGKFSDWGITVDLERIHCRHMANDEKGSRKWRIEKDVQTPGTDGREDKLLADIGIQIENEETGGILKKGGS